MFEVVWFKRDLRVCDHRAISAAAKVGHVLPLYIAEPELWRQRDMSGRHFAFVSEALEELRGDLDRCGQALVVRCGAASEILEDLWSKGLMKSLWSHEETGNHWTYRRDLEVSAWCRDKGIIWTELQNHGVNRGAKSRNGWAKKWDEHMGGSVIVPPKLAPVGIDVGPLPMHKDLLIPDDHCPGRQSGGRRAATELLDSFLLKRGEHYRSYMSSPLDGERACSRLSPHIAWGTLSLREITAALRSRREEMATSTPNPIRWRQSLQSYNSRLHWHCHFIQKLEDEPRIEFENLHRAFDGVRPSGGSGALLSAWSAGETGFPFVDACMRFLGSTGWLNFRMRAMVMAVASYHLWLHWREPGLELARLFTDYEPGIHWNQVQMQSGTTGINTIRIYNPIKQGNDQDPDGTFTRRWVPELSKIPDHLLQEPWKADNAAEILGKSYPEPIVDYANSATKARKKLWAIRAEPNFREEANKIQEKHGSRKSGVKTRARKKKKSQETQLSLPLSGL